VAKWLPRRWEDAASERALELLAARFEKRHGRRWLHDMLAAGRSERLTRGTGGAGRSSTGESGGRLGAGVGEQCWGGAETAGGGQCGRVAAGGV
jgi:hypothetical protein